MTPTEKQLEALTEKLAAKNARLQELMASLENDEDTLTEEEEKEFDQLEKDIKVFKTRRDRMAASVELAASLETPIAKISTNSPQIGNVKDSWKDDPKCGYNEPKAFLLDVIQATRKPGSLSDQLKFLAAAGSDEHSTINDSNGGFLVPTAFMPDLKTIEMEMDPTAGLVTTVPMGTQVVQIPARVDKNHSSSVSGGLTVSRRTETQSVTATQMALEKIELRATPLTGISYASEELLSESAISFAALLEQGFRDEFTSTILKEKIDGTGAGEAMGVLNSPCTISVAKESGQSADTINVTNITKMRYRCYNYNRAIWIANHDTYLQLIAAHTAFSNTDQPIFTHGNGTDVPDTLLGRPVFFSEYAKTLGDNGDIILGDWSQYLWGTREGLQRAESMHVRFLNNERTFRFNMRNTGAPWWSSALTPVNSTVTLSPFVTLAERA